MRLLALIGLLLILFGNTSISQTISGKVTDKSSGETLIGVNIFSAEGAGTTTDFDGKFSLKLTKGSHIVSFKFIGYQEIKRKVTLAGGEDVNLDIALPLASKTLDLVVVTGSQYEKKLEEEMVSVDVIQDYLIENTASPDLKAAVQKVPGVTILDGQVSIRGGSGYSYGVGSRVQLVIDDLPLLTGDLKDIQWSAIPMETSRQIEVVKGSSSSLYGSGAMNGVIHVRTGWATDKPETEFRIYQGIYDVPGYEEARWWDHTLSPAFTGVFLSHRRKIKNFEFVVGAHASSDQTYLQRGHRQAARINFKTRYKFQKVKGLIAGVNGNFQFQQSGRFILWKNNLEGAYIPLDGTSSTDKYIMFNVDPHIQYLSEKFGSHALRMRYYMVERRDDDFEDPSTSNVMFFDYRFQREFKHKFSLTSGIQYQYIWSKSILYSEAGTIVTHNPAFYAQVEKRFIDRVSVLFGMRSEYNDIPTLSSEWTWTGDSGKAQIPMIFRAGVNAKLAEKTHLRASFGQSFRFASIGERHVNASLGVIQIRPNEELQAEKGWSAEIGIKQGMRISNWNANADFALFWTEFRDMIEYSLEFDETGIFFKPYNVSRARVAGFEVGLQGDGNIGPIPARVYLGYTFNYPGDLQTDTIQKNLGVYMQNMYTSIANPDSLSEQSLLLYRMAHIFKADVELDFWKLTAGYTVEYNSYMGRIDSEFEDILPGFSEYREKHTTGVWRMDARLIAHIAKKHSVGLIVKNFLNEFYSVRPGVMDPPRSFTIQYKLKI